MEPTRRDQDSDNSRPASPHGVNNHPPARMLGMSSIMFWGCIALVAIAVVVILISVL
jgi:hypothetical protein